MEKIITDMTQHGEIMEKLQSHKGKIEFTITVTKLVSGGQEAVELFNGLTDKPGIRIEKITHY